MFYSLSLVGKVSTDAHDYMKELYDTVKDDERVVGWHVDTLLLEVHDLRDKLRSQVYDKINGWPSHEFQKKRLQGEDIYELFNSKFTELLELREPLKEIVDEYKNLLGNEKTKVRNKRKKIAEKLKASNCPTPLSLAIAVHLERSTSDRFVAFNALVDEYGKGSSGNRIEFEDTDTSISLNLPRTFIKKGSSQWHIMLAELFIGLNTECIEQLKAASSWCKKYTKP